MNKRHTESNKIFKLNTTVTKITIYTIMSGVLYRYTVKFERGRPTIN